MDKSTAQINKSKYAYVTFIIMNDSFLPGALMFAYGLRNQNCKGSIVCLVSGKISKGCIFALHSIFDKVIYVDEVFVDHSQRHARQDRPFLFSRFNALRLGDDGDLGQNYKKIIVCDADLYPVKDYDSLFLLDVPAGIINEKKENCIVSKNGKYVIDEKTKTTSKWCWHEKYNQICPHGQKIPMEITDKVKRDYDNMGVNSSLWVLEPSYSEYETIMNEIAELKIKKMISKFKWPEMQYATIRWSGQWTNIDIRYSSFNGYPMLEALKGTHFAGTKPWKYKDTHRLKHFLVYPDYYMWYVNFVQLMNAYNNLFSCKRLHVLYSDIVNALSSIC